MAVTDDFFRYVLEQLSGLRDVASRRMFGAVGLYSERTRRPRPADLANALRNKTWIRGID